METQARCAGIHAIANARAHCSGELGVLSPDGTQLTSGSWDKTVHVWEVVSDTQLYELKGHTDGVSSLTQSVGRTFSYRARHIKQGPRDLSNLQNDS